MPLVWMVFGIVIVIAALRAWRSATALRVGRWAVGALFVGAGALVNGVYLAQGVDYSGFADESQFAFVRETWAGVVAPDQVLFVSLLVAFELAVGVLVLLGDRRTELGLWAAMAFHVALLAFGWGFALWSLPMIGAFALLLRAQRRHGAVPTTVERRTGTRAVRHA